MRKIIRLTESDLNNIVKKILESDPFKSITPIVKYLKNLNFTSEKYDDFTRMYSMYKTNKPCQKNISREERRKCGMGHSVMVSFFLPNQNAENEKKMITPDINISVIDNGFTLVHKVIRIAKQGSPVCENYTCVPTWEEAWKKVKPIVDYHEKKYNMDAVGSEKEF